VVYMLISSRIRWGVLHFLLSVIDVLLAANSSSNAYYNGNEDIYTITSVAGGMPKIRAPWHGKPCPRTTKEDPRSSHRICILKLRTEAR
jgi:hypothetical protein